MKKYLLLKPLFLLLLSTSLAQSLDTQRVTTSTGVVMPNRSVTLAAKIVGRVIAINVEEGDVVKADDLLIDIGDAELRAELAGAEARLKQEELNQKHTKKLAERVQSLHQQQAASAEALDEANFKYAATEESVASAKAYVAKAKAILDETKIKAPFAGIIIKKRVEKGDVTEPGEPLLVLEDHDTLKFRTSVKEQDIPHISRGQKITIIIDALDDLELEATVSKIIPSGDLTTHEFIVEALLPEQDKLYPGMFGKAKFIH
ncbi:MAG: efflux RND transporter periplasmic adaptor subunit [Arenicellales bacterium]|nr:efflux RND transporter periplasmic adaptor subunit [Arenicellales bacterium]